MTSSFSPEDLDRARDALSRLRDAIADFVQRQGSVEASPAMSELHSFSRRESLHTVHGQSWTLLEVASDQLTAFLKTITEPVETIAPYTCVRSLLESAALACWLLDPAVDAQVRVGRSVALRHEGLMQQVKWARASGEDVARARNRVDDAIKTAMGMGYPAILDARGRPIGAGQRMPSVTEIIRLMLDEESFYRLLSAVAHGHNWALQQLSFTPAPEFDQLATHSGTRLHGIRKAPNLVAFALLIFTGASSLGRAAWYQTRYFGWNLDELHEVFETSFDSLNAPEAFRFWRPAA